MSDRKIAIVTGSRADISPMRPLVEALRTHENVGIWFIETDGLYGHEERIKSCLTVIAPDMVVMLGDRYETLVAASVAALMGIPIAHLCGGDETLGAVDNVFRHAITKLSTWHFPMCDRHAARIVQMGEDQRNVFSLGSPGVDALVQPAMSKQEIESRLGYEIKGPLSLVCYHPETLSQLTIQQQIDNLLTRLVKLEGTIIISGANADHGGEQINVALMRFANQSTQNVHFYHSYSQKMWISLMKQADNLIGNSSGFIVEGFTLQHMRMATKPKIQIIGNRQKGRYEEALDQFFNSYAYGQPGEVSRSIAEVLATIEIPETTQKAFHDR